VKNRPRREPRTRSTRGHAPRGLRAVAELFALDEEDVVLGGAALEAARLNDNLERLVALTAKQESTPEESAPATTAPEMR
jgi:hypothetical protein